jgi:fibro-slime domain-containing protein
MAADNRVSLLAASAGAFALAATACGPTPGERAGGDATEPDARAEEGPNVFADAGPPAPDPCTLLRATVRDFSRTHPDFETFTRDEIYTGIVEQQLGTDGKPVYAHAGPTPHTTGPAAFAQWYRDVPGVNVPIDLVIPLTVVAPGLYAYDDDEFFPIDGQGFGNEGFLHNYHFTTEIRTTFKYDGGETFTFRGDDDLWLFINGRLAIDLGGLHQQATQTVDLDARAGELGIVPGEVYAMDIFHAERHTIASTFHIETTIDCFIIN